MSWQSSKYDENPFADNNTETFDSRAPLTKPMNQTQAPPPPWLQDPAATSAAPANGAAATTTDGNGQTIDPVIPRMILYTRLINLVLSVLMILTSMLAMLTTQSATTGVLACYVIVFSCLLCCFETHLKQVSKFIAMNFGFMYSAKSRSFFMLFVGTILFSFSLFGKVIGLSMIANALFNMFILFRYPQYEDAQRNHAEAEIKDFLAANPAFSQRIFDGGVQAGTELFRSNPDLARQGFSAMFSAASTSASSSSSQQATQNGSYVSV